MIEEPLDEGGPHAPVDGVVGRVSDERLAALGGTLDRLTAEIRWPAPHARVFLVDYLTILPPDDRGHRRAARRRRRVGSRCRAPPTESAVQASGGRPARRPGSRQLSIAVARRPL
jgi:hypothetical protein